MPRPGCLSLSAFYTGAFPTTDTTHSHFSPYASEAVPGLDSDGTLLDFVNVQAYDGGPEFSPAAAFDAYRKVFAGPMLLGMSAAVESYGGFVVSNATALADAKHVWADGVAGNGVFVWNWQDSQKHAPTALQIVQVAHAFFNTARVTPPSPPSPPRPPPPLPHSPPPPPKPKHRPPPPHPKPKGKGR